MDDTLTAGLAVQKARKVTEQLVPELVPEVVARRLPDVVEHALPAHVKALLPAELAAIYVPPKDGTDGKAGPVGPRGATGPQGPSGFDQADVIALMTAWEDLRTAVLTPRKRTVVRDNMGRITGLTE